MSEVENTNCHAVELAVGALPDVLKVEATVKAGITVVAVPMELKPELCNGCGGICNMRRNYNGKLFLKPPIQCTNESLHPGYWSQLVYDVRNSAKSKFREERPRRRWSFRRPRSS